MKFLIKIIYISILSITNSALAFNTIKIKILHPDKEEKTYSFSPSEKDSALKLKLSTKTECFIGALFSKEKNELDAYNVECYAGDNKTAFQSLTLCGGFSLVKVQEEHKKKTELTSISSHCE